jgi:hypothetical protein
MTVRYLMILPGLELELHFADHISQDITRAVELLASVIARIIAEDDVYVTGAILDEEGDKFHLGFYRHPIRFVRYYGFERNDFLNSALEAVETGQLAGSDYNSEHLEKLKKFVQEHRIW